MVERGGLENRCARKRTEGSNPSPSATKSAPSLYLGFGGRPEPRLAAVCGPSRPTRCQTEQREHLRPGDPMFSIAFSPESILEVRFQCWHMDRFDAQVWDTLLILAGTAAG